MLFLRWLVVGVTLVLAKWLSAQPAGFVVSDAVTGLNAPTCIAFAPNGNLWIGEKGGTIKIFSGSTQIGTFGTIACTSNSERGVLGLAFDPNFATNHFVYVYYTTSAASLNPPASPKNRVSRFTELSNAIMPGSETILVDLIPSDAGNHNAGCLRFGFDGKLYIATGDGGSNPGNSQDLTSLAGKILRINPDGAIPNDNPFFAQPPKRPEIFLYGLRNPFRFSFRPSTNVMYVGDVGQGTWEELDVSQPGGNYGWPIHEGAVGQAGFVDPIHAYNHNGGGASITGGSFVGTKWPVDYQNRYLFADYVLNSLRWLSVNGSNQATGNGLFMTMSSLVDFALGPDGALYAVSIGTSRVKKIAYAPTPSILFLPTTVVGGKAAQGWISLNGPACAAGQAISLTSSKPAVLSVQPTENLPPGIAADNFDFSTVPVDNNQVVTITAAANGGTLSETITVLRATIQDLTLDPEVVIGTAGSTGTITLTGNAGPSGLNISLSSGNTALAQVPANLSIPAGAASGTFPITTFTPSQLQQTVSINATLGNQSVQKTFTVKSQTYLVMSLNLYPSMLPSGKATTGRVVISPAAGQGGVDVAVTDNASVVFAPPTVTVPQGATGVNFTIPTTAIDSTVQVTIQASIGASIRSAILTLQPCPVKSLKIFPATVTGGLPAVGQVILRNAAPSGGALVSLADYSNYVSVPPSVMVAQGSTTANFDVETFPVANNVIATIAATYLGCTRTTVMTVTNVVALKSVSVSPSTVKGGVSTTGTVTLTKAVPSGTFTVNLSDNLSVMTVPASVTVIVGQVNKNFTVTTSAVATTVTGTIIATANGITRTTTLTITP